MAVRFLVLLTLTTEGRKSAASAGQSLTAARAILEELGGTLQTLFMTYGQYDAAITGECPTQEALTHFVAWINEQGYFSTQTQLGVDPATYTVRPHG